MLKRVVVVGVVGAFLAVPPAIAKSSSTVVRQAPAAKAKAAHTGQHNDGRCPLSGTTSDAAL